MKSVVKIWRESKERYRDLNKVGRVVSWTKIHQSPNGFGDQGYVVVMVKLVDKTGVVGQLVGDGEVKIGDEVVGVLRKLREPGDKEVIEYGVKWKKL